MHFFGSLGTLSFVFGLVVAIKISLDKIIAIYRDQPVKREVVEQPLFFLALVALIIGVQLFLAGFVAELIVTQSQKKRTTTLL